MGFVFLEFEDDRHREEWAEYLSLPNGLKAQSFLCALAAFLILSVTSLVLPKCLVC